VTPDGRVTGVSAGTGAVGYDAPDGIEAYNRIPADDIQPYGQGLYLIFAATMLEPR
jgi:hypothetical protein